MRLHLTRLHALIRAGHLLSVEGDGEGGGGGTEGTPVEWKPPASQADMDRVITERLSRERAKFADYDDVKAKAARLDELEAEKASDLEKAVKAATETARAEVTTEIQRERVLDKIEVAAATKFADVEDARLRLGRKVSEFIKDGVIDTAAIAAEVEAELTRAPHLRAVDPKKAPHPDRHQGGGTGKATAGVGAGKDMYEARRKPATT